MLYSGQIINLPVFNTNVKQINAVKAKKLFEMGEKIYVHPCNMLVNNGWQNPAYIKMMVKSDSFDQIVNAFKYYNCNAVIGKRVLFFMCVNF